MDKELVARRNPGVVVRETKRSHGKRNKQYGVKSDPFSCVVIPSTDSHPHDRLNADVKTFFNPLSKTYERGDRVALNLVQCLGYACMFLSAIVWWATDSATLAPLIVGGVLTAFSGVTRAADRLVEPGEIVVPLEPMKKNGSSYEPLEYSEEKSILKTLDPTNKTLFIDTLNKNHTHLQELVRNQTFMELFRPVSTFFVAPTIVTIREKAEIAHKEAEAEVLIYDIVVRPYNVDYLDEQLDEVNKKLQEVCNTFIQLAEEEQRSEKIVKSAQKRLPKVIREEIANDLNTMVDTQLGELRQLAKARELANNELAEKLSLTAK